MYSTSAVPLTGQDAVVHNEVLINKNESNNGNSSVDSQSMISGMASSSKRGNRSNQSKTNHPIALSLNLAVNHNHTSSNDNHTNLKHSSFQRSLKYHQPHHQHSNHHSNHQAHQHHHHMPSNQYQQLTKLNRRNLRVDENKRPSEKLSPSSNFVKAESNHELDSSLRSSKSQFNGKQQANQLHNTHNRTNDKAQAVFKQFDSGKIDENLIDRILKENQELINNSQTLMCSSGGVKPQLIDSKLIDRQIMNDNSQKKNQLPVLQTNNSIKRLSRESKSPLPIEIIENEQLNSMRNEVELEQSRCDTSRNNKNAHPDQQQVIVNYKHQFSNESGRNLQNQLIAQIDSQKQIKNQQQIQDDLQTQSSHGHSIVSSSQSNTAHLSPLSKSSEAFEHEKSPLGRPLFKSLNKSISRSISGGPLILLKSHSPASSGNHEINGFAVTSNDLKPILNAQKSNVQKLNKNLILANHMNGSLENKCSESGSQQTDIHILNSSNGNTNAKLFNLRKSHPSLSANSSCDLSSDDSKTNHLAKILPNLLSSTECISNLTGETRNRDDGYSSNSLQFTDHNSVASLAKRTIRRNNSMSCNSKQRMSSETFDHHKVIEQSSILLDRTNDSSSNQKAIASDVCELKSLNREFEFDTKDEMRSELKAYRKQKILYWNNNNQFRNQFDKMSDADVRTPSPGSFDAMEKVHDVKSIDRQSTAMLSSQLNTQTQHPAAKLINNSHFSMVQSKSNLTNGFKHQLLQGKNMESDNYSSSQSQPPLQQSSHYKRSHHYQNPFYKPPRFQDKIMSPDSYPLNQKPHNWRPRKGSFSKYNHDKKYSNFYKTNEVPYSPAVQVSYPKLIHSHHDIVSNQIWKLYILLRQTQDSYRRKIELRQSLYKILRHSIEHDLYIVGSSLNGLGTITSDVDMCILLPEKYGDIDQTTQAIPILGKIRDLISMRLDFVNNIRLIEAKVPILKFTDKIGSIEVDLNINNIVGIRNTQLVKFYTRLDWRVTPLAIAIKAWAHFNQINSAHKKSISSYTLVLMLIHFLQVDCSPPILPCLHSQMPHAFRTDNNVKLLNLYEDLPEFRSDNKQSLSELFIGFLDYFGNRFDYATDVISVRAGRLMKKEVAREYRSPKNTSTQWHFICCEEPFDRTNTARSVSDYESYKRVTKVFQNSYCRLKQTHNLVSILNLEQLFGLNVGLSNGNLSDLGSSKNSEQSNESVK